MTLKLTARQRLAFAQFLGSTPGCKNPWDSIQAVRTVRLLEKIRLPEEELEKYIRPLGNGQAIVDNSGLRALPDLEIEIGTKTVDVLRSLFKAWEPKTVDELAWSMPIKEQIDPVSYREVMEGEEL